MTQPSSKRRRSELSLKEKIKLIQEAESTPKPTLKTLSERFDIGKSTVGDILRRKSDYVQQWEKNATGTKFRFGNPCRYDPLNDLMWDWFCRVRSKNIPLSGPIIQDKATNFAAELGFTDFKASNGWLERWKARYSVKGFKVSGEGASVDQHTVEDYKTRLHNLTNGYEATDIFNCDETGLYFKALPTKTLAASGDGAKGTKVSKDRLTILFACSATGEKLQPLLIGKSANPRALKNVQRNRLGVTYVANKKAWMTSAIFTDWLHKINADMKRKRRHILLFLDNATSHPPDLTLSNIKLCYLPPNTTSHLQPLDQGIIRTFKAAYRKYLLRSLLSKLDVADDAPSLCRSVTILDAIQWTVKAWSDIKASTIEKCFRALGFDASLQQPAHEDEEDDDNIPLAELVQKFQLQLHEVITMDEQLDTEEDGAQWEADLVSCYKNRSDETAEDVSDDDVTYIADDVAGDPSPLTLKEIQQFSVRLRQYSLEVDSDFVDIASTLNDVTEQKIVKARCERRQTVISDFFKKM